MKETERKVNEIFFIGSDFYQRSGTMMSPIYHAGSNIRCDWGKVELMLRNGEEVNIRQATDGEMLWAYKKLEDCQKWP
jgi:hypothetical protein